jgi:branched-chain amino acid transport system substrate-binding protein
MKAHGSVMRSIVLSVAVLAAVIMTAGAGASASGKTLTIGIVDSETGVSAAACLHEQPGMQLAVAEAGHTYLKGVPLKLAVQDDQSTAAGGVTGFQFLKDSSAIAVAGPCSSTVATAIAPLLDPAKVPVVYSTASAHGILDPEFAFAGGLAEQFYAGRVVQVMKGKGIKTVYVMNASDNPVFVDISNAVTKTMKVLGMNAVGTFTTTAKTIDFGPAIQQIQQSKPDAVAVLVRSGQVASALTQLRNAGIKGPFFGAGNWSAAQLAGAMMTGGYFSASYASSFPFKSSKLFTKEFEAKFKSEPGAQEANGYDSMSRVLHAIKAVGPAKLQAASTSQARVLIQKALAAQKSLGGAQGPLLFLAGGDVKGPGGVVQITDDKGSIKQLKVPTAKELLGK